jgi:hypothetical protein
LVQLEVAVAVAVAGTSTSALSALIVATGAIDVILSSPLTGATQEVINGISVEKIFAVVPAESNGAGSSGSVRSAETSMATEISASTSISLLRSVEVSSPLGLGMV